MYKWFIPTKSFWIRPLHRLSALQVFGLSDGISSQVQILSLVNPKNQDGDDHNAKQNCTSRWPRPLFILQSLFWISRSLSGFTAHVSKHRLRSNSKSWHFHFSRYKSLIRRWTIVMSSLSVAPKTIWNMYPVAAMWVTEGWTQRQTLEYLCSYDHQNQLLVKSRKCSLLFELSMLKYMIRRWTSVQSQSLIRLFKIIT